MWLFVENSLKLSLFVFILSLSICYDCSKKFLKMENVLGLFLVCMEVEQSSNLDSFLVDLWNKWKTHFSLIK
jgi:hypothetical protein